ncbi:MAG: IPT/TIG domain-containing protein [Prevotella sp.]
MNKIIRYSFLMVCLLSMSWLTSCSDDDDNLGSGTIKITGFSPEKGLPGTEVTINGSGFSDEAKVYFNEAEATDYVSRSANAIVVRVPENAASGRIGVVIGEKDYGFSAGEFTFIPSAAIEKYSIGRAPAGETITIYGRNFFDIDVADITVRFGNAVANVISATSTEITVVIPEGAETAPVTIQFGDIQTIEGPVFEIGQILVEVPDYYFNLAQFETGGGNFDAGETIGSTKRGAYLIYACKVDVDGLYELTAQTATNQGYACYLNLDMGTDMDELAERAADTNLSQLMLKQGWATWEDHTYGPFRLKAGQQYYMRVYFWAEGTSWAGNAANIALHYADNQDQSGIEVGGGLGYNIYASDFNSGESLLPFSPSWAWEPSYIKVVDQCAEFYFNQAALDADNRRERRGCELTSGFKTNSEGWYGFKIFLPEGKFSKDLTNSIIAQIFNNGDQNSWAGHLSINKTDLVVSHRYALIDPTEATVGALEWNKWIPVVMYFRAGRNGKGQIKVWLGDGMDESKPTYDSKGISFGYGEWIDDTHLNDVSRDDYKGASFGAKFGLYVSSGGDRTIRFDDVKLLEGNPEGAFGIVKP